MKLKTLLTAVILVCALGYAPSLKAQPDPGGDPDTEVPIDGGVSLLIAAGVAYGAKKAYDKRKKGQQEQDIK
ncbi:MAG: hypothetical protein J0I84_13760 [Terrimonas sp.]|uniref:PID-CTERM protein-sorting domain-containing protein n=1 Tax=Terrimonas sp. TaxID=1914338 RepID=UPI000925F953|nr:hypothetical protein [Terrimonas sp.]MBN8788152.1 hypothetical protein [Terrimonas sp.]OJY92849.1 MAG: hypothetical protein BGP13_20865 [Sphingobacteriales bacterium 40-81]PVD54297.1 hypothetical protein DC498_02660 [Terrimonas sp.]